MFLSAVLGRVRKGVTSALEGPEQPENPSPKSGKKKNVVKNISHMLGCMRMPLDESKVVMALRAERFCVGHKN